LSDFHNSAEWVKLSKAHKAISRLICVDCGSKKDLESDHVLPASKYKHLRLKLFNLVIRCKPCNQAKSAKVYLDRHTFRVWLILSVKGVIWRTAIAILIYLAWQTSYQTGMHPHDFASYLQSFSYPF